MRIIDFFDGFSSATDPTTSIGLSDAIREAPTGLINNSNTAFSLSFLPLSDQHLLISLDGLMLKSSDFSLAGATITMTIAPAFGQELIIWYFHSGTIASAAASGTWNVEYPVLNNTNITNKFVTISNAPSVPSDVLLDIIGGSSQEYSVDFIVSGVQLSWNGLALDGILLSGDKLRITYISA